MSLFYRSYLFSKLPQVLLVFVLVILIAVNDLVAQSLTATGSLQSYRWGHESEMLNDGNVLVMGGNDGWIQNTVFYSSCELYNTSTGSWSYTGSMIKKRSSFTAHKLPDGKVLAIGGQFDWNYGLASCEIYDPNSGTWSFTDSLNKERYLHKSINLGGGEILVAGGLGAGEQCEIYDVKTDAWRTTDSLNIDRQDGLSLTMLQDGRVLATGGNTFSAEYNAEIFDPVTELWTMVSNSLAMDRKFHHSLLLGSGEVLLTGGISFTGMLSSELFDPSTNQFTLSGNFNENRGDVEPILMDNGDALIWGLGDFISPGDTKVLETYERMTETWSTNSYTLLGAQLYSIEKLNTGFILLIGGSMTTGNGASALCYLVDQTQGTSCSTTLNGNLSVSGGSICFGSTLPQLVSVQNSQIGVAYQGFIGNVKAGSSQTGNGGTIQIEIPSAELGFGLNVVRVFAQENNCIGLFLSDTANVTVSQFLTDPVITAVGSTSFCSGDSVVLSASAGFQKYLWSTGDSSQNLTVSQTGYYNVSVEDVNGCLSDSGNGINTVRNSMAEVVEIKNISNLSCGNYDIEVKLTNFCVDTLLSSTINYSVNGNIQSPFLWTGSLSPGSTTGYINLGSYYFSQASNLIKCWTSNPNGISLASNYIDTTSSLVAITALSGSYTIGGNYPDYGDIQSAVQDLSINGMCGPVVFNIRPGTYDDIHAINIVTGSSPTNTITFQSENGDKNSVIITNSLSLSGFNWTFRLLGKHINFHQVTLEAIGSLGTVLMFEPNAENIEFNDCTIRGVLTTSGDAFDFAVVRLVNGKNIRFINNLLENGSTFAYKEYWFPGYLDSIFFVGNTFLNNFESCLEIANLNHLYFQNNIIKGTQGQFSPGTSARLIIENVDTGLYIQGNTIRALKIGMIIEKCDLDSVSRGQITNNMVYAIDSTYSGGIALLIMDCSNIDILFNTLKSDAPYGSTPSSAGSLVRFFNTLNSTGPISNLNFSNNILITTDDRKLIGNGNSYTGYDFRDIVTQCDHNCFYTAGPVFSYLDYIGFVSSMTFAEWQGYTNYDSNSLHQNINFVSGEDLHVVINSQSNMIEGQGEPVGWISSDIDGDSRDSLNPDIGADEFSLAFNISPTKRTIASSDCSTGEVRIKVINSGQNTITSFNINWTMNDIPQPVFIWLGSLSTGQESSWIGVGNLPIDMDSTYSLKIWTSLPNGNVDESVGNDTIWYVVNYEPVEVSIGEDTTICNNGTLILNGGLYNGYLWSDNSSNSTLAVASAGTYTLQVTDSLGCLGYDTIIVNEFPASSSQEFISICDYDSIYMQGEYQTQVGAYIDTLSNTFGCDSIVTWLLTVVASPSAVTFSGLDSVLCSNGANVTLAGNPVGGVFSGQGVTGNQFSPSLVGPGEYAVTYIYTNLNNCLDSTSQDVTVALCSGLEENARSLYVLYPNPSDGKLSIVNVQRTSIEELQLYESSGKLILTLSNFRNGSLDLTALPKGIYFLEIKTQEAVSFHKVVIQ